ncbi:EIN3-binding F-box protein 2-like [Solanum verrucosum]|uniref:EIN3-binding F-box protein 2-like n=1 Tax=Solanum verrucosum TaxID=315347 RepID=UPI0020D0E468|nr:EIN3-binding F-box protein 2-like [Solanum verrucosum]
MKYKSVEETIGNGAFFQGSYPSPKQSALFLSHRQNGNVYVPSWKRICVSTTVENFEQEKQSSNEFLLDECLVEVFKHLSSGQERSACACISKRWLMLLSSIRRDEAFAFKPNLNAEEESTQRTQVKIGEIAESAGEATDVRLAAIVIGTANLGGLVKLSIWGDNLCRGVTDTGLKAIARGCPTLKHLFLWDLSSVGDEGLSEIAHECHLLEKLDLFQCPTITDKSLLEIFAVNCPNMTSITMDSCSNIGNESLKAVGQYCLNLKLVMPVQATLLLHMENVLSELRL